MVYCGPSVGRPPESRQRGEELRYARRISELGETPGRGLIRGGSGVAAGICCAEMGLSETPTAGEISDGSGRADMAGGVIGGD